MVEKISKTGSKGVNRRRFLAATSIGLGGLYSACSNQMGARAVRHLVAETGRVILPPSFIPKPENWDPNRVTASWLGHSTVLLNVFGVTILTDPVLGCRVGADTLLGTIGAKRLIAPALEAHQLPPVDLVLLSHAHMDHLDPATLRALRGHPQAVTAKGTLDLVEDTRVRNAKALAWGETTCVRTPHGDVEISAFQVKHWGARWRVDTYRGYNGYVISRGGKKIIFGGDTALIDSFRELKARGPYDLAIMPIGAYEPWISAHCTPEQAVQMANDAGAEHLLPVHFKTFTFGREGVVEPMERLSHAISADRIALREVGQTFQLA